MSVGDTGARDPIAVLYVDTDVSTCQRVENALNDRATAFDVLTETDPQQVLSALDTTGVDCLVSRYDLGATNGVDFLRSVRRNAPELPFILFTDTGDEETASRAISAGVTDYVRKGSTDGLESLARRIRAVVANELGHGSDYGRAQLGRFLETFPDVVFVIDEDGRYLDVVSSGDGSLLYEGPEQLLGERFSDVLPGETADRFLSVIETALETDEQRRIEYSLDVQSGPRWFESRVVPLRTDGGSRTVFWSARDITERKRREREYEQIFNSVRDAIAVFDPERGKITEVNDAYREMLGYDLEAIRTLGIEGLSASDEGYTGERGWDLIRETAETGEAETVEWRAETNEGERLWLEATLTPAEISGELRVLSIQRDVTERKRRQQAVEALREATERLEAATTPEEVGTIAADTASDALDLPNAICWFDDEDTEGLEPVAATDEVRDAELVTELPPDRYEHDIFRDGTVTEYAPNEHSPANPLETGVLLPLADHGLVAAGARDSTPPDEVALDAAKALADHVTTALDRVERAQAVRESERRFRLIAERIDEVIYLANTDFTEVLYVNPAYETIWGRPVEELYDDGKKFIEAIDPRDREAVAADIEAMIQEMQRGNPADSYEFEYRIRQPDGQLRWVSATGYAVEMYGGERRFVGIVKDITERKRREQRLEVFNRILRHNLRNQLDVIRTHAETLAAGTDGGGDHAERIITAVDDLAGMGARARKIDRIMSMDGDVDHVSLPELVDEVVRSTGAEQQTIAVTTELPASAELTANQDALYTAVKSALENAIEHADSEVCVTVDRTEQGYDIVVDDDGPGISNEQLAPIEAGTETRLTHGRGLGLWQLRWGVDVLNGELSFETSSGTTVRISVPDHSDPDGGR